MESPFSTSILVLRVYDKKLNFLCVSVFLKEKLNPTTDQLLTLGPSAKLRPQYNSEKQIWPTSIGKRFFASFGRKVSIFEHCISPQTDCAMYGKYIPTDLYTFIAETSFQQSNEQHFTGISGC